MSLMFAGGCGLDENDDSKLLVFTENFDFNEGMQGWDAGFADFPSNSVDSAQYELKYAYSDPIESKLDKRSVMVSGKNVNRDLFMYLKRKIDRLEPNKDYTLTFNVEVAADMNATIPSAGGAVYLKAGASSFEPKSVIDRARYIMNIDNGNDGASGSHMTSLGDIPTVTSGTHYSLITRNNSMANSRYVARTNANGELWLIVGTDSNLEGRTALYYTRINVVFSAS